MNSLPDPSAPEPLVAVESLDPVGLVVMSDVGPGAASSDVSVLLPVDVVVAPIVAAVSSVVEVGESGPAIDDVGVGAAVEVVAVAGVVDGTPVLGESVPHAVSRSVTEQLTAARDLFMRANIGGTFDQSRRRWTSVTRWSAPLRSTSDARSLVGAMFSRRLRPLISRQMDLAVPTASSLVNWA